MYTQNNSNLNFNVSESVEVESGLWLAYQWYYLVLHLRSHNFLFLVAVFFHCMLPCIFQNLFFSFTFNNAVTIPTRITTWNRIHSKRCAHSILKFSCSFCMIGMLNGKLNEDIKSVLIFLHRVKIWKSKNIVVVNWKLKNYL